MNTISRSIFYLFCLGISSSLSLFGEEWTKGIPISIHEQLERTTAELMRELPTSLEYISAPQHAPQKTLKFTGATLADSGQVPPDTMGVVGPFQFIIALNGLVRSFDKENGQPDHVLNLSLNQFFNSVRNDRPTTDPRIRFDRFSKRWYITCITAIPPDNNLLLAFSDGEKITSKTVWTFLAINLKKVDPQRSKPALYDFDTLGIDRFALYIGVNVFFNDATSTSDGFVINKNSLLNGGPIFITAFRDLKLNTPQGVDNFDNDSQEGFFIGLGPSANRRLFLRRIKNPGGIPEISPNIPIKVEEFADPIFVPQKGTFVLLEAEDARLGSSHIRNRLLYTSHHIGLNNLGESSPNGALTRNGSRWYVINMKNILQPALAQSGTLFTPSRRNFNNKLNYWMSAVMTNGLHTMVLGCSTSGLQAHPNATYSFRFDQDCKGKLQEPITYTESSTTYNPQHQIVNRWGDYSHVSVDPTDDLTLWAIEEFCNDTNSWGVKIIRILASPPPKIVEVCPCQFCKRSKPFSVTIRGKPKIGSAYFDPGSGFSKHLQVHIQDVEVLSIDRVKPHSIDLTVSTRHAKPGKKTITITNPDGQKVRCKCCFEVCYCKK